MKRNTVLTILTVLTIFVALSAVFFVRIFEDPKKLPANEQVMYGNVHSKVPTNEAEHIFLDAIKEADRKFMEKALSTAETKDVFSKRSIQLGWSYFHKKDYATSMKRFNQAWLLDKENGDAYYGFALITIVRDGLEKDAEKLFKIAISKSGVSVAAHVDYGRFLWTINRLDESISRLKTALEINPKAYNAHSHMSHAYYLKGDYSEACRWGKLAEVIGEKQEDGYLEDMCSKTNKASS